MVYSEVKGTSIALTIPYMKEKGTASPTQDNNILKILAILAILLAVGIAFWLAHVFPVLPGIDDQGKAAITLWLWNGDGNTSGGLSTWWKRTPDLGVSVLALGYLNEKDEFIESDVFPSHARAAARISVENKGASAETKWHMEADLPTQPPYTYVSEEFSPLQKNESRVFVLSFDHVATTEDAQISVRILSDDEEKNIENNSATSSVAVAQ